MRHASHPRLRLSRDLNCGLAPPVRWVHQTAAAVRGVWVWAGQSRHPAWRRPLLLGMAAILVLLPFDLAIVRLFRGVRLGGDVRREMELVQQFGAPASVLIAGAAVWLLDPARRRRLVDWALCIGAGFLAVNAAKVLLGRPRPKFALEGGTGPFTFLGPLRSFGVDGMPIYSWEFWRGSAADLWSMPSSHTSAAVVTAVVLTRWYPPLRPLMVTLAAVVGICRVVLGAHYPSDVVAGAALGYAAAAVVLGRGPALAAALAPTAAG